MVFWQVSPSIPTQADPPYSVPLFPPGGTETLGKLAVASTMVIPLLICTAPCTICQHRPDMKTSAGGVQSTYRPVGRLLGFRALLDLDRVLHAGGIDGEGRAGAAVAGGETAGETLRVRGPTALREGSGGDGAGKQQSAGGGGGGELHIGGKQRGVRLSRGE